MDIKSYIQNDFFTNIADNISRKSTKLLLTLLLVFNVNTFVSTAVSNTWQPELPTYTIPTPMPPGCITGPDVVIKQQTSITYTVKWCPSAYAETYEVDVNGTVSVVDKDTYSINLNQDVVGTFTVFVKGCNQNDECGAASVVKTIKVIDVETPMNNFSASSTTVELGKPVTISWESDVEAEKIGREFWLNGNYQYTDENRYRTDPHNIGDTHYSATIYPKETGIITYSLSNCGYNIKSNYYGNYGSYPVCGVTNTIDITVTEPTGPDLDPNVEVPTIAPTLSYYQPNNHPIIIQMPKLYNAGQYQIWVDEEDVNSRNVDNNLDTTTQFFISEGNSYSGYYTPGEMEVSYQGCSGTACSTKSPSTTIYVYDNPIANDSMLINQSTIEEQQSAELSWIAAGDMIAEGAEYRVLETRPNGIREQVGVVTHLALQNNYSFDVKPGVSGKYSYELLACNLYNFCVSMGVAELIVTSLIPSTPTFNEDVIYANTASTLSWITQSSFDGVTYYELEQSGLGIVYSGPDASFTNTWSYGEYGFRVRACNNNGCSASTDPRFISVNGLSAKWVWSNYHNDWGSLEVNWPADINPDTWYEVKEYYLSNGWESHKYHGDTQNTSALIGPQESMYQVSLRVCLQEGYRCTESPPIKVPQVTELAKLVPIRSADISVVNTRWTNDLTSLWKKRIYSGSPYYIDWQYMSNANDVYFELYEAEANEDPLLDEYRLIHSGQRVNPDDNITPGVELINRSGQFNYKLRACNQAACTEFKAFNVTIRGVFQAPDSFGPTGTLALISKDIYFDWDFDVAHDWAHVETGQLSESLYSSPEEFRGYGIGNVATDTKGVDEKAYPGIYSYRARECRPAGCSLFSRPHAVKVEHGSLSKPPAPTNLQVPDSSGSIPAYFNIRWDSVPREYSKYGIVYYINEIADYDEVQDGPITKGCLQQNFLKGPWRERLEHLLIQLKRVILLVVVRLVPVKRWVLTLYQV
jgi:hypothetical protein